MRKAGKAGRLYATSIKKAEPWGPLSLSKIHQYFLGKRFLVEKN